MLLSDLIFECLYKNLHEFIVNCESHADSDFRGQRIVVGREDGNRTKEVKSKKWNAVEMKKRKEKKRKEKKTEEMYEPSNG